MFLVWKFQSVPFQGFNPVTQHLWCQKALIRSYQHTWPHQPLIQSGLCGGGDSQLRPDSLVPELKLPPIPSEEMAGMTPKSIFFFGQLENLESKTTCLDNFLEVLLWNYNPRYPRYSPYGCRWFSFAKQPTWGSNQEKQIDFTTKWSEKIGLPPIVKGNRTSAENTDT